MGFYGDLEDLPLQDILYVLTSHGKSGVLTLSTPAMEIRLEFDRASIASVGATDGSLRIGHVLVSQGYVTPEQIEEALGIQAAREDTARLGDLLVESGFVTRDQVQSAVHAQLEASLFRILIQSGGTFEFESVDAIVTDPIASNIRLESMVLNAMRLADEWRSAHDPDLELFLTDKLVDVATLAEFTDAQRKIVMSLLNGHNTVDALAIRSELSAEEFSTALDPLLADGLIQRERRSLSETGDEHPELEKQVVCPSSLWRATFPASVWSRNVEVGNESGALSR